MLPEVTPVEVFCSYARDDEAWLRKIETHLSLLQRQGLISLWHDRLISPGTNGAKSIDAHLETASIILLLISADFLASDYCYSIEMTRALERQKVGQARVIPILVRAADLTNSPLAQLHILPTDVRPLASWPDVDIALADITQSIRRIIAKELPRHSVNTSSAALPRIWDIPYPHNPYFTGREEVLVKYG